MEITVRTIPQAQATTEQVHIPLLSFALCAVLLVIARCLPAGEQVETTPELTAEDRRQGGEDAMWTVVGMRR